MIFFLVSNEYLNSIQIKQNSHDVKSLCNIVKEARTQAPLRQERLPIKVLCWGQGEFITALFVIFRLSRQIMHTLALLAEKY